MQRFFSETMEVVQTYNPVHLTGAVLHLIPWVTSSFSRKTLHNPQFTKYESKEDKPSQFPRGIAIYCVHGTADRPACFSKLATRMLKNLPEEISTIHFVQFEERCKGIGIPDFAEQLLKQIEANNESDVFIMGHSRGGIIAIETAIQVAVNNAINLAKNSHINIHTVISIASPIEGSHLARKPLTFISKSVEQMEIGNPYLVTLPQRMGQTSGTDYIYIAAENDYVVLPEACYLKSSTCKLFDRHGHLSIMSSRRVPDYIAGEIIKRVNQLKEHGLEATSSLPDTSLTAPLTLIEDYITESTLPTVSLTSPLSLTEDYVKSRPLLK